MNKENSKQLVEFIKTQTRLELSPERNYTMILEYVFKNGKSIIFSYDGLWSRKDMIVSKIGETNIVDNKLTYVNKTGIEMGYISIIYDNYTRDDEYDELEYVANLFKRNHRLCLYYLSIHRNRFKIYRDCEITSFVHGFYPEDDVFLVLGDDLIDMMGGRCRYDLCSFKDLFEQDVEYVEFSDSIPYVIEPYLTEELEKLKSVSNNPETIDDIIECMYRYYDTFKGPIMVKSARK